MTTDDRELTELRRKLETANAQLARHERMSRIALLLVLLLGVVALALVAHHLRDL